MRSLRDRNHEPTNQTATIDADDPVGYAGHSVLTEDGGMLCGRLADVAANTDPAQAQATVAAMVAGLADDFHGADVEVTWEPPGEPGSWTARVAVARTPPNAGS
ncbi:hypothetical protein [Streptomyces sp. NPDC055056]